MNCIASKLHEHLKFWTMIDIAITTRNIFTTMSNEFSHIYPPVQTRYQPEISVSLAEI